MLWGLTETQIAAAFVDAPALEAPWIGVPLILDTDVEMVPAQFGLSRFLVFFACGLKHVGDDPELMLAMATSWTGGFVPEVGNRVVKFIRADATDPETIFDSDQWKLAKPHQAFQFGEFLVRVVLWHAELHPHVTQYFFKPENTRLERFYLRAFKSNRPTCASVKFAPILDIDVDEGGFYGYQRTSD